MPRLLSARPPRLYYFLSRFLYYSIYLPLYLHLYSPTRI